MTDSTKFTYKGLTYKGFTPLSRLTEFCKVDAHSSCTSGLYEIVAWAGLELAKKTCCLCQCHFGEVK